MLSVDVTGIFPVFENRSSYASQSKKSPGAIQNSPSIRPVGILRKLQLVNSLMSGMAEIKTAISHVKVRQC